MHKFAGLNFQIKDNSEISLSAVSSATLYGRGVFTTIAVYHRQLFQWEKHWERLGENAARIGVDLSEFTEDSVNAAACALVAANEFLNGRLRLTFFDESAKGLWSVPRERQTSLLITSADFRAAGKKLNLTLSPFPVNSKSPLVNLKSSNYLENILAFEEAQKRGFDETVRLNENGEIVSCAMANLFWVKNGEIFTPELSAGALRGTTRSFVLENFQVSEVQAELDDPSSADEIFITSAGIGIAKATGFAGKIFENTAISDKIQNSFDNFVQNLAQE